jgi:PIN domain nuclease of toxin-antitoxin system
MPTSDGEERPILLDTHVWVWLAEAPERLSSSCVEFVRRAEAGGWVCISPISVWELAMLARKGRLALSRDLRSWVRRTLESDLRLAPLTPEIAIDAGFLPGTLTGDPADRLLVATARALVGVLVTRDARILEYAAQGHVMVLDAAG